MLYLHKNSFDPWFNLAAEEYVLKHSQEDVCMLWRNAPCVVVGKHQQTLSEINRSYLEQANIPVIRRITGGGAVYHDLNCLNYSFITNAQHESDKINFERFTLPVRSFLQSLGIDAQLTGKSNITVGGKKISGNAAHLFKNRSIHHGTLLFNTELNKLENSILNPENRYHTRAVQSIRATVVNLAELLPGHFTIASFSQSLQQYLLDWFGISQQIVFDERAVKAITKLAGEKYKTWAWTYGYSPDYTLHKTIELPGLRLQCTLSVRRGLIEKLELSGANHAALHPLLNEKLKGIAHEAEAIRKALLPASAAFGMQPNEIKEFIHQLF